MSKAELLGSTSLTVPKASRVDDFLGDPLDFLWLEDRGPTHLDITCSDRSPSQQARLDEALFGNSIRDPRTGCRIDPSTVMGTTNTVITTVSPPPVTIDQIQSLMRSLYPLHPLNDFAFDLKCSPLPQTPEQEQADRDARHRRNLLALLNNEPMEW